jgi:hypothetical protein
MLTRAEWCRLKAGECTTLAGAPRIRFPLIVGTCTDTNLGSEMPVPREPPELLCITLHLIAR